MNKQTPNAVLMIEPLHFGFNEESALYNPLQKRPKLEAGEIAELARKELASAVSVLKTKGVNVILVLDDEFQQTPSSVFPSGWISFHEDSRIVAYPLAAKSRKEERRGNILNIIIDNDFPIYDIIDISASENEGKFLHGTESMVFDRINKVVYASLSETTDEKVFTNLADKFGYFPVSFSASIEIDGKQGSVQTNQVLSIADQYAIVCLEAVNSEEEKEFLKKVLIDGGKQLIEITKAQLQAFVASSLQVESANGKKFLVISRNAYSSLTDEQVKTLKTFNELLIIEIPTIEEVGGASVSSVLSGIFLPK